LSEATIATVVERTGGVPLFVEELTRAVLEGGETKPTAREIPVTLHDSLMARLDRLGSAKELAQVGAVIGGEFSYELLHEVYPLPHANLEQMLRDLIDAELLYVRGVAPDATYRFKHALIRDAAYEALLKSRRSELHRMVARAIDEKFPALKEAHPEVLARHWAEAGLTAQAITSWQRAGQKAVERSANAEAISHFKKGLELLRALPETIERAQDELTLQIALAVSLIAMRSWSALEVGDAYTRARDLSQQTGDTLQLSQALYGLWSFHIVRAECDKARELGEQFLSIAQRTDDNELLTEAHAALGSAFYSLGEFTQAREHFERSIALHHLGRRRSFAISIEPGVFCTSFAAQVLWCLGYPQQALELSQQSVSLSERTLHPFSRAWALGLTARLHQFRGEKKETQKCAEMVVEVATEQGFSFWIAWGNLLRGWVLADPNGDPEGLARMRQGLAEWQATDSNWDKLYFLGLLAERYGQWGQADAGIDLINEALMLVEETGERRWEAEIHRLKGQLLLRQDDSDTAEAERCFRRAMAIAQKQKAKSLELRASMSLARVLESKGNREEARTMLAEIYDWFTEGFDTPDLIDAKSLLAKLS
jgi:predicted ATPase